MAGWRGGVIARRTVVEATHLNHRVDGAFMQPWVFVTASRDPSEAPVGNPCEFVVLFLVVPKMGIVAANHDGAHEAH